MEETLIELIKTYGYIILFLWCMLEGEMALIMGGILSHTGDMNVGVAIFIAGIGGFAGDQVYFYIGRYNKSFITKKLRSQRRKFAIAHLLMKKYGSAIIFIQRYLYGLRTILPMSIGLTRYDSKKFAIINLISAWMWACITIIPAYLLGEHILEILSKAKEHWYIAIPVVIAFLCFVFYAFKRFENSVLSKRKEIKYKFKKEVNEI